jgi:hypothetical protein
MMLVVVVMMPVAIMAIVAVMIAAPWHRLPRDCASASAHDCPDRSPDSRPGGASDNSSAHGVFTSRCAGRSGECNTESSDENGNAHGYLPLMIVDLLPTRETGGLTSVAGDQPLRDLTPHPVLSSS